MALAMDRLVAADTLEGKRKAARWAAAWSVAAGGAIPRNLKLRARK